MMSSIEIAVLVLSVTAAVLATGVLYLLHKNRKDRKDNARLTRNLVWPDQAKRD